MSCYHDLSTSLRLGCCERHLRWRIGSIDGSSPATRGWQTGGSVKVLIVPLPAEVSIPAAHPRSQVPESQNSPVPGILWSIRGLLSQPVLQQKQYHKHIPIISAWWQIMRCGYSSIPEQLPIDRSSRTSSNSSVKRVSHTRWINEHKQTTQW